MSQLLPGIRSLCSTPAYEASFQFPSDVTDRVLHYWYYQDDDPAWGPIKFREVPWYGTEPTTRLYVVQRVRQTSFVSGQSTVEPIVFSRLVLKHPEQYDEDNRTFQELSRSAS